MVYLTKTAIGSPVEANGPRDLTHPFGADGDGQKYSSMLQSKIPSFFRRCFSTLKNSKVHFDTVLLHVKVFLPRVKELFTVTEAENAVTLMVPQINYASGSLLSVPVAGDPARRVSRITLEDRVTWDKKIDFLLR